MNIYWVVKKFEELTVFELYGLLRLREQVFIIEQNCIYPDLDNNEVVAYSRIFRPGDYFDSASIGRVVTSNNYRNQKLGFKLMQKSIEEVKNKYDQDFITISAQYYLLEFYKSLGFAPIGETYLEDDIPHIRMIKE
jgi:ElaA protein